MVKIGMMIGDRYEILEKIGTGGMSDVYKAKCHKLNRYVAVKVLKQEFSENANFVSKFKIEAQAAAGLMHSNIVNVYDVGEENGIHYIVMELVEGITLKKYIEKKARLSYKEAVSIAIQVSMGIDAAHKNHIIHRDIKPQNIIISKDGKVKVTDFGIAKAATSNTITSNVMGSVHYTSPEQARGGYSDEKSDIYSLGVTMFEMLTGRVPFNGETTVAIAIKHIQEEMPSPRDFVAEIPPAVESIVLKCCQKSPDRRYQNMQELVADLKQSLVSPDEDFVDFNTAAADNGTRTVTESDIAQIKRQTGRISQEYQEQYTEAEEEFGEDSKEAYPGEYEEEYEEAIPVKQVRAPRKREKGTQKKAQDSMRLKRNAGGNASDSYDKDAYGDEYEDDYNPRLEKLTTILAIVAGLLICLIVIFLAIQLFNRAPSGNEENGGPVVIEESENARQKMPRVTGVNVEDAKKALTDLGLVPKVEYEDSETVDVGVVISASVSVGTLVEKGSEIVLTVSAGAAGVEVPDLKNELAEVAGQKLTGLGFLVNEVSDYSETVEEGRVISQNPEAGTKAPKKSAITITVSKGKQEDKVRVPNFVGLSEEDATVLAVENGLVIGVISYTPSTDVSTGLVCYQSEAQGSYVDPNTVIDLRISQGLNGNTYKYNGVIEAPTVEEAPEYVAGSEVKIVLTTDDGQVLINTKVNTFPKAVNFYGLTAASGTLSMTYTVQMPGTNQIDPNTGEVVNVQGENQERSFVRIVYFTKE